MNQQQQQQQQARSIFSDDDELDALSAPTRRGRQPVVKNSLFDHTQQSSLFDDGRMF